ncbi:hypothetical protein, partial [Burkholderia multivorans]
PRIPAQDFGGHRPMRTVAALMRRYVGIERAGKGGRVGFGSDRPSPAAAARATRSGAPSSSSASRELDSKTPQQLGRKWGAIRRVRGRLTFLL